MNRLDELKNHLESKKQILEILQYDIQKIKFNRKQIVHTKKEIKELKLNIKSIEEQQERIKKIKHFENKIPDKIKQTEEYKFGKNSYIFQNEENNIQDMRFMENGSLLLKFSDKYELNITSKKLFEQKQLNKNYKYISLDDIDTSVNLQEQALIVVPNNIFEKIKRIFRRFHRR